MIVAAAAIWKEQLEIKSLNAVLYWGPVFIAVLGFVGLLVTVSLLGALLLTIVAAGGGYFQSTVRSFADQYSKY